MATEEQRKAFEEEKEQAVREEDFKELELVGRQTAQDIAEQTRMVESIEKRGKEALFEEVRGKMERIDKRESRQPIMKKVGGFLQKGFTSRVAPKARSADKKVSGIVRKALNITAPKGSLVEKLTRAPRKQQFKIVKGKKVRVKSYGGRGRPSGSYSTKILPFSGRAVKVPIAIYKKMVAAEKTQYRLARAERLGAMQAQAEQLAQIQDPRYRQGSEEQFLAEPDMQHEQELQRIQEQAQMQAQMAQYGAQEPSTMQKVSRAVQDFGRGLNRVGGSMGARRTMVDQYGRPLQPQQYQQPRQGLTLFGGGQQPQQPGITLFGGTQRVSRQQQRQPQRQPQQARGLVREPRVSVFGGKANLLNVNRRRL